MSYTVESDLPRISPSQWAGGHDRVFVSMVAAPMSPLCRMDLFPATSKFLNFSNRTIVKGDMAPFMKQCQNHVFSTFSNNVSSSHFCMGRTLFVRADNFRR